MDYFVLIYDRRAQQVLELREFPIEDRQGADAFPLEQERPRRRRERAGGQRRMKLKGREMLGEPKTIRIDERSPIARLLAEAHGHSLRLTAGAVSYRVTREDALARSDPAAFNAAIDRLTGSWSAEDAEAAIDYIYQARERDPVRQPAPDAVRARW